MSLGFEIYYQTYVNNKYLDGDVWKSEIIPCVDWYVCIQHTKHFFMMYEYYLDKQCTTLYSTYELPFPSLRTESKIH